MYDLYFWPTPNGLKIAVMLEELGAPYRVVPVNIGRGDQFEPSFLAISPNNRMPALVDNAPADGGPPLSIFESGAILQYLADKHGRLGGEGLRGRVEVHQWLFWQVAGLGPMSGQANHFRTYASERLPYAIERYTNEVNRLYGVMDRRLADHPFLAGDYSIADIACYPWTREPIRFGQNMANFPHLSRWQGVMAARPGVVRGLAVGGEFNALGGLDDEAKRLLFNQTAASVKGQR